MKHILVVDDDQNILNLLKEALPALGYKADFADSGLNAIAILKEQDFDLILADIRMPHINGIEVARAASSNKPHIPILFMSGNPNNIVEERSFLPKPFTIDELETKIEFMLTAIDDLDD